MSTPLEPHRPRLSVRLTAASIPDHDITDDAVLSGVDYAGVDLSGRRAELLDVEGCRFRDVRLGDGRWRRATLSDSVLESCDLANLELVDSGTQRVRIGGSRLTGLVASGCSVNNTAIVDGIADLSNWRFAKLDRVVFDGCRLIAADFTGSTLTNVTFVDCDLSGADMTQVGVKGVRISRCTLTGLRGVASLSGASIDPLNLLDLTLDLAAALGITIEVTEGAEAEHPTSGRA